MNPCLSPAAPQGCSSACWEGMRILGAGVGTLAFLWDRSPNGTRTLSPKWRNKVYLKQVYSPGHTVTDWELCSERNPEQKSDLEL